MPVDREFRNLLRRFDQPVEISVVARDTFSERAHGDIKVIDIFSDRFATITFSNIPVDRVSRSDRLSDNSASFRTPRGLNKRQVSTYKVTASCQTRSCRYPRFLFFLSIISQYSTGHHSSTHHSDTPSPHLSTTPILHQLLPPSFFISPIVLAVVVLDFICSSKRHGFHLRSFVFSERSLHL